MVVAQFRDWLICDGARTGAGRLSGDHVLILQQPVPQVLNPAVTVEGVPVQGDLSQSDQSVEAARRHPGQPVVPDKELRRVRRQTRQLHQGDDAAVHRQASRPEGRTLAGLTGGVCTQRGQEKDRNA